MRTEDGGWKGNKGGEMTVDVPGQHVLERTSCSISSQVNSLVAPPQTLILLCPANSQVQPWGDLGLHWMQALECGNSV